MVESYLYSLFAINFCRKRCLSPSPKLLYPIFYSPSLKSPLDKIEQQAYNFNYWYLLSTAPVPYTVLPLIKNKNIPPSLFLHYSICSICFQLILRADVSSKHLM